MKFLLVLLTCVPLYAIEVDKVAHASTAAVIALSVQKATSADKKWIGPLAAFALGLVKEFLIDRQPDPNDIVANGIGATWAFFYLQF